MEEEGLKTDPRDTGLPETVFTYFVLFLFFLTPVSALGLIHLCAVLLYSSFMCFGVTF